MRIRTVMAFIGGTLLVLSSAAHAFLGWPAVSAELKQVSADHDLNMTVAIGWIFGSVAMLTYGLIVLRLALRLLRGKQTDSGAVLIVGVSYAAFGLGAFLWTSFDPHFIGFVVIGLIVAVAALWPVKAILSESD